MENRAIAEARKLTQRIVSRVLRAWRKGRDPGTALVNEMQAVAPTMTTLSVAAHLTGIEWMRRSTNTLRLATSQERAVDSLRRRLDMDPDAVAQLATEYDARVQKTIMDLGDHGSAKLSAELQAMTAEGVHVREGTQRLRDAMVRAGVVSKTGAPGFLVEGMFRTQTQMAYNVGQWQSAQDPVIQEILWGYEYVTVGDDRVRPEHLGLEGTTAPKDHPIWDRIYPPNGWACRCAALEIFEPEPMALPPAEFEDPFTGKVVEPGADRGFDVNFGKIVPAPPGEAAA
jgi:SPP1 gp7 family putative phage head morphogenesis protein